MGLTNVAGVFSRYFIIGFFLPAFFCLVVLAQAVGDGFLPGVYEEASSAGQIAIVGGAALLLALVLLGLQQEVLRTFEGYPLRFHQERRLVKPVYEFLLSGQRRRFEAHRRATESTQGSDAKRFDARWKLDRRFPHDSPELLLPTAFGNVVRAFERHSWTRWHLNAIAIWPHVENMLSTQEAQVLADVRGDVAFFVNSSLLSALTGLVVIADTIADDPAPPWFVDVLICVIPFAVSLFAYHAAISAAARWGAVVRAGIDLHRREVYAKLGVRAPLDFGDERRIAWRLNATLLVGDRLPDDVAAEPILPGTEGVGGDGRATTPASQLMGRER